jgi:hypothetical protein
MYERKKEEKRDEQLAGEIFTDWDNPEDWDEGEPEGYYDDEEDDDSYVPDEDDPDYDLSEAHGYADWEPKRENFIPQWLIIAASLLLIFAILIPILIRIS